MYNLLITMPPVDGVRVYTLAKFFVYFCTVLGHYVFILRFTSMRALD